MRIVIVRASRIGDFVCATPAFRALRLAYPDAELTLVGLPFAQALVQRSRRLDHFQPFPGFPGIAEQFFEPRIALGFFGYMQAVGYDLALQLHGSGVYSNPFTLMLGARATIGFVREGDDQGALAGAVPFPTTGHECERTLALLELVGAAGDGLELEFPLFQRDHDEADRLLARATPPLIGVHAAASDATKRWNASRFARAASRLQQSAGGTVVLLGGPGERPLAAAVRRELSGRQIDLSGQTSLPVLGAVIDRLALLLTNDSGPAHIAYARRTPSVTMFGATDPARWGPPPGPHRVLATSIHCRPCDFTEACPRAIACLSAASVQDAVDAAEEAMTIC